LGNRSACSPSHHFGSGRKGAVEDLNPFHHFHCS
jgi:hypothetical protein